MRGMDDLREDKDDHENGERGRGQERTGHYHTVTDIEIVNSPRDRAQHNQCVDSDDDDDDGDTSSSGLMEIDLALLGNPSVLRTSNRSRLQSRGDSNSRPAPQWLLWKWRAWIPSSLQVRPR